MWATLLFITTSVLGLQALRHPEPSQVDKLRYEFLRLENKLWNYSPYLALRKDHNEGYPEVALIKQFEQFGDILQEKMPLDVSMPLLDSVWSWAKTYSDLRGIYALYESFRRFQKQQTEPGRVPSPQQAWLDLADTILNDPKNNVNSSTARIQEMIESRHLLSDALKEVSDMFCSSQQSPQQVIYNLYNTIALTELKGYTMIQFSYMLLKLYGKGNFTKEAELMRTRFEQRSNNAVDAVKLVMGKASREYWKCDPKRYIKSETYEEITQLMQGYVQNEVDLNPEGTCRENCGEYQYTKSHGCFKNLFCRQQRRCNGKIINCRYVDSDMLICPASPHSGRRYEYIEYENGLVYGRKMGCMRGTTQVDSWWRWLFWHCSYCMCLCDEQGPFSDRYFNMRAAIANIANNRVITGLRFVKKNRIIHLQIQEGELMPYGSINVSSVHWVPPENYRIEDYKIYSGQDYHILTWEKRAIDLDDLVIDKDHVITGVRFKEIGSHLNFEIYVTPFNFTTGKLINAKSKSVWKDNSNTDVSPVNPRTKVRMVTPDIPTRTPSPSEMKSKSDQYVEFTHTDFERDAAQTTVPFLDTQPVDSVQPVPLSGAGIYFKGKDGFGGFIAPKIITYDYAEHLVPVFPERKKEESLHDLIEPEIN